MSGLSVTVVGGGIAGTTAALAAADAGATVTLVERKPRLGGLVTSFTRDELELDTGQHVFLRCCSSYRGLLRRLGAEGLTTLQDRMDVPVLVARPGQATRRTRLRRSRRALPPPLHLAAGLLGYRALPLPQRVLAGLAALSLGRLDPGDPRVDAEAFGPWLRRRGTSEAALSGLWELLTVATLNTAIDEASLALATTVVTTGLLETPDGGDIGWARVPLARIHDDAARRALEEAGARVLTGAAVRGVRRSGEGWAVDLEGADAIDSDAVVLAVPPDVLPQLAPPGALAEPDSLHATDFSPIVNIHLVYDRPVVDEPFVAVVGSPVQWVFDRTGSSGIRTSPRFAASRSPQCLALSLSAADDIVDTPVAVLRDRFAREMERLFLGARGARLLEVVVTRERHATPRQVAGSAAGRVPQRTPLPGLALAGAWTATGWPATMESAARSGVAAAGHALSTVAARSVSEPVTGIGTEVAA